MADSSSFGKAKRVNSIRIKNNNSKSSGEKIIVDHYVSNIEVPIAVEGGSRAKYILAATR